MPELPEVQTTVNGLNRTVAGLTISAVWTSYNSAYYRGSDSIKDPVYFKKFKKQIVGARIIKASRRAKNIFIHIRPKNSSIEKVILVHMKMTGHFLFGRYEFNPKEAKDPWIPIAPESLKDPYNRHIRFVISLSNKKQLALSDVRKFASVTLIDSVDALESQRAGKIGPEPLDDSFDFEMFRKRISLKPNGKIKQVLMDQSVIAGIGNIYADESLWHAGIMPTKLVWKIPEEKMLSLFKSIKKTLSEAIITGGASTSDYRNIDGEKGRSHEKHHAYQRQGDACDEKGCEGMIQRITLGGRGTHFCNKHQK